MKIRTLIFLLTIPLFTILAVIPASAHHAFAAEFDANKLVRLRGTVTKMEWLNPHSWIYIELKDSGSAGEEWMVETGSPNTLLRQGLTRDSLKAGMEIVVEGYRAKDGSRRANGRDVTLPDGQTFFLGTSNPTDKTRE